MKERIEIQQKRKKYTLNWQYKKINFETYLTTYLEQSEIKIKNEQNDLD